MSQAIIPVSGGMGDIRNTLMTMFMVKNVHSPSTGSDIYGMIYMMIVTGIIDLIMKYLPALILMVQQKYTMKMSEKISSMTTDILDNKLKTKTGSVIMDIVVNDATNIISQAVLDYITNHRNTIFVSYKKQNYLLNQKEVISLEDDYYACMQEHLGNESSNNNMETQRIEIYSFIHNTTEIRKFIDKLTYTYSLTMKNKLGNQRYFFNMTPYDTPVTMDAKPGEQGFTKTKNLTKLPPYFEFVMKPFQTNRSFGNLFGEKMETIRERVKFFIQNKRWYDEKGIPYTLGILLSGPPGTGKTSTIKCIANETNRHIFNINLNNDITKKQLENLFFNENVMISSQGQNGRNVSGQICIPLEQRIYVLEDIDCQSNLVLERNLETENPTSSEAVDLSFLLNLLDGVLENPGRIVIMTSNYPERLDRALVRPGRIDVIAKFEYCSHKTIMDMIEFFYDRKLNETEKNHVMALNEYTITPAELSKIMFENFGNYQNVFQQLGEHVIRQVDTLIKENGVTFLNEELKEDNDINVNDNNETKLRIDEYLNDADDNYIENRIEKDIIDIPIKADSWKPFYFLDNRSIKTREEMLKDMEEYENKLPYDEESKKYKQMAKTTHTVNGYGEHLNEELDGIGTISNQNFVTLS